MTQPQFQHFKTLSNRINQMAPRERALGFFAVMALLYVVADGLVLTPLFKQNQQLEAALRSQRAQVETLENQIRAAVDASSQDVDADTRRQLVALREQLAQRDPALSSVSRKLVSPAEMVELVEQMLSRNRNLQVIRVENVAAEPLESTAAGSVAAGKSPTSGIYRHGMRIEVRGGYADLVNYLRELEALPWRVLWGRLSVTAEEYPNSRMTLMIYTLSMRPGWMGT